MKNLVYILIATLSSWSALAQVIPPTNIFTATGNQLPPPAIPPLTQVHVPQFNGDHSTNPDLARRQLQSITEDGRDKGMTVTQFETQMARLWGSNSIKPPPGSPGALHYAFAFQIVPPITGTLSNGRNITWNWIRFSHPDPSNPSPKGVMGGYFVMRGDGTSNPPASLFTPPPNATPPVTQSPTVPTTPGNPPAAPLPKPTSPVKVSVHTWAQMSTGGRTQTVVMRMIGNFRGITTAPTARRTSRPATTQATGQPSRPTLSRGILFRGHGSFTLHIRSLRSLSAQRMSLRAGGDNSRRQTDF